MRIMRNWRSWLIPWVIFGVLVFWGSTLHALWGDEAETALYARSILKTGLPYGWDGVNIMGLTDAVALDERLINYSNPWPQYYLAALSFKLFGESSFTARLPFAALSLLIIPLLWGLVAELTGNNKPAGLSAWLAGLSVPLILFCFQARYFSLVMVSGLLFSWSVLKLGKNWKARILAIASGTVFVYSHYISFLLFYPAFLAAYWVFSRLNSSIQGNFKRWLVDYLFCGLMIALIFTPWFFILAPYRYRGFVMIPKSLSELASLLWLQIQWAFGPHLRSGTISLGILLCILIVRPKTKYLVLTLLVPVLYLCLTALLTVLLVADNPFTAIRYNVIVLPFWLAATAVVIFTLSQKNKFLATILGLLYVFTNLLTFSRPRSYILDYLYELTHPYQTANEAIAEFLSVSAKDGETVFLTMDRDHEPLIFLLKKQLVFVNRISPANPRLFPKNREILPKYLYLDFREPDWVIVMGKHTTDGSFFTFDQRPVFPLVNLKEHYEEIVFPVHFADQTRPELDIHAFRQPIPTSRDFVYIYRKISQYEKPVSQQ